MKKKILSVCLCIALLSVGVFSTLAYFTDTTEEKTNTFTIGKVDIELDETSDDSDGYTEADDTTTDGFSYENVVPGTTYAKKPVITVASDSRDAYVFAELTITDYSELRDMIDAANADEYADDNLDGDKLDEVFLADSTLSDYDIVGSWMDDDGSAHLVYSLGVLTAGDSVTLFKGVTVPAALDKSLGEIENAVNLNVKGYAVQEENIADVEAAYNQFFTEGYIS